MAVSFFTDGRQSPVTEFLTRHVQLDELNPAFDPTRTLFKKFEGDVLSRQQAASDSALSSESDRIRSSLEQEFSNKFEAISGESEAQINTLEGRVATLDTTNRTLKASNATLEKNVEELQQALAQQQQEHASALVQASKSHKQELESLRQESAGLAKELNASEEKSASFEQSVQTLQEKLTSTLAGAEAFKAQSQADKAKLTEQHKAALASSSSENSQLQRQVKDLKGENSILNERIALLEAKLAQTEQKLEESKLALAEAKTVTTADKIKAYAPVVIGTIIAALGAAAALR
jgi:chromosome segregation ATPase